jgi:hypothetical protein
VFTWDWSCRLSFPPFLLQISDDIPSPILHLKFVLYCFEWLSGLKINYHKSEAYIFGVEEVEKIRITNMLNYQLGSLPIKYLGIKISDCKLGKGAFCELQEKIAKRVSTWKRKNYSSGWRLILTNSCLTSLPFFTMGFYLLPLGTHRDRDSVRARFFWRGVGEEFKYHMARWPALCRPKDLGELGIINTQILNECLMTKSVGENPFSQVHEEWTQFLQV